MIYNRKMLNSLIKSINIVQTCIFKHALEIWSAIILFYSILALKHFGDFLIKL